MTSDPTPGAPLCEGLDPPRLPPTPPLGAHVSTAGGLAACLDRAARLGAEVIQIFSSPPRRWAPTVRAPDEVAAFGEVLRRRRVPLFVHTIYLLNLATPDDAHRRRSAGALAEALRFGALAGAAGVVTHVGSHGGHGFEPAAEAVTAAAARARDLVSSAAPDGFLPSPLPRLLLEGSAGARGSVGRNPWELGRLLRALANEGIEAGLCLDTAHLFAAGFPVHTAEGLDALLSEVEQEAGPGRLGLVHLNDSASPEGSGADRHANLWEGGIGRQGLGRWVRHRALAAVPFVLEVPGFDGKGPDRKNLRRARSMRRG